MHRLREASAALLLALVATAAILPLTAAHPGHRGCHCAVRMACCEEGTCTMGGDEPPATSPEWRSCRREAPAAAATPLDAFERALTDSGEEERILAPGRAAEVPTGRLRAAAPYPATPPPAD